MKFAVAILTLLCCACGDPIGPDCPELPIDTTRNTAYADSAQAQATMCLEYWNYP